ncbi:hypothetical protein [Elizabethkingia anophelis]|uniref:hypothetical protein n=1 Tax=Elizabethkingia anophelis TaxID=1117645 RepID=UPI00136F6A97|nr:hypothetical protein [Elizabethkingia anophelis]MYY43896.1 hypothetical protein [Elizabethkingia anophelis]
MFSLLNQNVINSSMRLLTTKDIETWADTFEYKYHLSHLVRRLILATLDGKKIKDIHFPYKNEINTKDFDGKLITEEENIFVPQGISIWRFGTPDHDDEKMKSYLLETIPSKITCIQINAKRYRDKYKWAERKKSQEAWKDVRYLDSEDIKEWLELAPDVELWFAEILMKPTLGICSAQKYWQKWSENESLKIEPEILLGKSRLKEIETIKSFLINKVKVLYVQSMTLDESLAFSLAVFQKVNLFDTNIVVIDNHQSFIQFIDSDRPLIIILKFKITPEDLREATQKGHKIIIPITPVENGGDSLKIQLPAISKKNFESALYKMGINGEQAIFLTENSGRNITLLKELLKFGIKVNPQFLQYVDLMIDFIPMLLVNKFCENSSGDLDVIEKLSGKKANQYIEYLNILESMENSPVYRVDGIWKIVSAADTWIYLAKYLSLSNMERFQEISIEILGEVMHKYTLSQEELKELIFSPKTKYSSQLRDGICESLAVISVLEYHNGIDFKVDVSAYIKNIVDSILEKEVPVWKSLSDCLPILAEVSPEVFLNHLERMIQEKTITTFFENRQSFLRVSNDSEHLLNALSVVAWFPKYIMQVSTVLCEIILLLPKDNSINSRVVFDNLKNIYKIRDTQTNVPGKLRKRMLKFLARTYPDILFSILFDLINHQHDAAYNYQKPKWKVFSELSDYKVNSDEMDMHSFCVDHIIALSEKKYERLLLLISILDRIEISKIENALYTIESALLFNIKQQVEIYHQFRKILGKHRSNIDASWSLPVEVLYRIEKIAEKFIPDNYIDCHSYLFEEQYPDLIKGTKKGDYLKYEEDIIFKRLEFVNKIISEQGVAKIIELSLQTNHPYLYGNVLALCDSLDDNDLLKIYRLVESNNRHHLSLVNSVIGIRENNTDLKTQIAILEHLINQGLSQQGIVNFFHALSSGNALWDYISKMDIKYIEQLYWQSQQRFLYTSSKEDLYYALDKLAYYNMTSIFLNTLGKGVSLHKEVLSTEELVNALEKISPTETEDESNINLNLFNGIWELIYSKGNYNSERIAEVEMKFITVFAKVGAYLKPRGLYAVMSKNSNVYFEILSRVCLPEKELKDESLKDIKKEIEHQSQNRKILKALWQTLNAFNFIPSLQENGSLNYHTLKKWIFEVRKLGKENNRMKVTDHYIGKLLARYPISILEDKGFAVEIYDILEEINTDEIKVAFYTQLLNYTGYTGKGESDGGEIERIRVDYFAKLFQATEISHPHVADIFKRLELTYRTDWKKVNNHSLL